MAKIETPPVLGCGADASRSVSEYWINPDNFHWMQGDIDTGIDARGFPGLTPYIGENGNWWIGKVDTGEPANGIVIESGPQSASELF